MRGGGLWVTLSPLRYESDLLRSIITVPAGFSTDLASTPRLPVAYLLAGDTAHEAAVVHDWLYQVRISTRAQADAVLDEAMAVTGEPAWRRWLMWAAVRAAGGWAWYTGPRRYSALRNYRVADRRAVPR